MHFINRSLSNRGSSRRVRSIRPRDHWSPEMTIVVFIAMGALAYVLYRAIN